MSYILSFVCDGLTEEERDIILVKLDIIKSHVYSDLDVKYTLLHRANRVSINQEITDVRVALECFHLLSNFTFPKQYDEYYEYGDDSRITCQLSYTDCVELGDDRCVIRA